MQHSNKRLYPSISILMALVASVLFDLLPNQAVSAHPADMYAQEQTLQIGAGGLQVDWKITPGPILAGSLWETVDQLHNGQVTTVEAQAWIAPYLSQWSVRLDNQPLPVQLKKIHWPISLDALQSGDQPIDVQLTAGWPSSLKGKHLLEVHNAFQEPISLNWFSVQSEPGIAFSTPAQQNGALQLELDFSVAGSAASTWESGKPSLPGITGVVSNLASGLANTTSTQTQNQISNQANPSAALVSLVRTQNFTPWFLIGALLLSMGLGSLHALTPGHGKTLVAAYLVGSHGRARDAVFLGSVVTLTHTGSVLILGLVTLIAARYVLPTLITPWLEVISGLLVIGFGALLLAKRGRAFYEWYQAERQQKIARHFSGRVQPKVGTSRPGSSILFPHSHEPGILHHHDEDSKIGHDGHVQHSQGDLAHSLHEHSHGGHDHPHSHALPAGQVTWKSLLSLGISGGLVPCPDAIAILLVAVALNRIPFGMLLIVSFSLGLALVLIAIGIAMVQGARFLSRNDFYNRFSIYTPVASALVVLALGLGLTLTAGYSLISSPSHVQIASRGTKQSILAASGLLASPPSLRSFNLNGARLIYLAQDNHSMDQVFTASLAGKEPVALTQEPEGIDSYQLSPDGGTIVYTALKMNGTSSIWSMNNHGGQKRLLLDCPQGQCGGPVWSPDGKKLVYERHDESPNAAPGVVPIFSIWWLDPQTGETKPMFRDQSFPSFAPRFSPDGQWMSYISPSSNTVQIYNLAQDLSLSVPERSGVPEIWSPTSDSILFWGTEAPLDPSSPDAQPRLRLKRYELASAQVTDLGGLQNQEDYNAVWSPDGKWIALVRMSVSVNGSSDREQVWLVRPDGTQGHAFLSQEGVNYGTLSWSSDGRYLVYNRYTNSGSTNQEIWLADTQSGQQKQLLSNGYQPAFLP